MNEHIIDKCCLTISHGGMQNEEIIHTREYSKRPSENPEGQYPYRVRVLLANLHGKNSRRSEAVIREIRKTDNKKTGHLVNRTSGGRMNLFLFNQHTFKLATARAFKNVYVSLQEFPKINPRVFCFLPKFFFNTNQLVILRISITSSWCTCFNLPGTRPNHKISDKSIFSFSTPMAYHGSPSLDPEPT